MEHVQVRKMRSSTSIRVFSAFNIILGIISICLQIAAILLFSENFRYSGYDYIATGIWAGMFYVISGGLGIPTSKLQTRPRLLIWITVMTSLSLMCSITAIVLTAINSFSYHYCYNYPRCDTWMAVENTLLGFSSVALINNIVLLILTSKLTCCRRSNKSIHNQPQIMVVNGQPMYVVHCSPPAGMMQQSYVHQPVYSLEMQPQKPPPAYSLQPGHQQLYFK